MVMDRFVGVKEASELIGVRPGTIYFWKFKRIIPCYKLPTGVKGKVVFKLSELLDFVNKGRIEANGENL
jgi:hypothetical protein